MSRYVVCILDPKGLGTGLVVSHDGWVVTNKHVAPNVGPFRVVLADGRNVAGVGVHQSKHLDLAVVKLSIDTPDWFNLAEQTADVCTAGSEAFAIGHPRGCRFSVAQGIISNPYRTIREEYFVQTDVPINPGNSGGPLLDKDRRLVGIVSMMAAGAQGLGFAVPGPLVADYVREARRLVESQVVSIPEAVLAEALHAQQGPEGHIRDGIDQLISGGRAEVEMEEKDQGQENMHGMKLRRGRTIVEVTWADNVFVARGKILALGPEERKDAVLLLRLLELNAAPDLGGASIGVEENGVFLTIRRGTEHLSSMDAFAMVDRVLQLSATWSERVGQLVIERQHQGYAANQAQNAPAPYAAAPQSGMPAPQVPNQISPQAAPMPQAPMPQAVPQAVMPQAVPQPPQPTPRAPGYAVPPQPPAGPPAGLPQPTPHAAPAPYPPQAPAAPAPYPAPAAPPAPNSLFGVPPQPGAPPPAQGAPENPPQGTPPNQPPASPGLRTGRPVFGGARKPVFGAPPTDKDPKQ
ncbi:MAG: trypsin-like peptidase domain-containing protein [Myxococcota bacterium]